MSTHDNGHSFFVLRFQKHFVHQIKYIKEDQVKTKFVSGWSLTLIVILTLFGCTSTPVETIQAGEIKKNTRIILMVSDGIGFNGWLAADYYQGKAGNQTYQITRPDNSKSYLFGLEHTALNFVDNEGDIIPRTAEPSMIAGAIPQTYDPTTRWTKFENAMSGDFTDSGSYTSYTDSAAAGTALLSGRKTTLGRLNKDWTGKNNFTTIAELAMQRGLSGGAVASVMVSHATPAAVISHNVSRNNYAAIFNEMIESDLDVIMGAGHPFYDNSGNRKTDELDYQYVGGEETFEKMTSDEGINGFTLIETKADFTALANNIEVPERVVGIAQAGATLQAAREELGEGNTPSGMAFNERVPDLATMSVGALNVLENNDNGFFLMIEGGAIDWMGHANNMPRYIEEQMDFNKAVDAVIQWVEENTGWDETLLIVTSDHECGGIWGEGTWTNSVGGPVANDRSEDAIASARFDPKEDTFIEFLAVQDKGKGNLPGFQFSSGNHTNDLVPLWAIGNGAEKFIEFTRTDRQAAKLWGDVYDWDGNYVDNTSVFDVMLSVLQEGTK